jgi:hypothetical protein
VGRRKGDLDWPPILDRAREIVLSYDTPVTLRQLFYRLVSFQLIPNTRSSYQNLGRLTAELRRRRLFPRLMDRQREIHRAEHFDSVKDALTKITQWYRLDRTKGQAWNVFIGVEKAGIVEQLEDWFEDFGIPILALGGYSSQTYVDEIRDAILRDRRPAALLYAGDFDPSGEDIDRDFVERVGFWDRVVRVALTADRIVEYDLPVNFGKASDSRASQFIARYGRLVQVELDALDPNVLRALFIQALSELWDDAPYQRVLRREKRDLTALRRATGRQRSS